MPILNRKDLRTLNALKKLEAAAKKEGKTLNEPKYSQLQSLRKLSQQLAKLDEKPVAA